MNLIDYWFLDSAKIIPTSFSWIIPDDEYEVTDFYRTPPNLTTKQIIEIMHRLFQDGILLAINAIDLASLDTSLIDNLSTKAFIPSRQEIKAALIQEEKESENISLELEDTEKDLFYFLTAEGPSAQAPSFHGGVPLTKRGGELWESIAKNIWNSSIPPNGNLICCANLEIGKRIITCENLFDNYQYNVYLIENSIVYKKFSHWYPSYWKTLSYGYVISYRVELKEVDKNFNKSQKFIEEKNYVYEWFKDITNWYDVQPK